jgi:hypothetical protein
MKYGLAIVLVLYPTYLLFTLRFKAPPPLLMLTTFENLPLCLPFIQRMEYHSAIADTSYLCYKPGVLAYCGQELQYVLFPSLHFVLSTPTGLHEACRYLLTPQQGALSVKVKDAKLRDVIVLGKVAPRGRRGNTTKCGLNFTLDPVLHFFLTYSSSHDVNPTSLTAF